MEQLREILFNDMDAYDMRLLGIAAMLQMAENAADCSTAEDMQTVFRHTHICINDLRAELDAMRGTMVSILTEMKESA